MSPRGGASAAAAAGGDAQEEAQRHAQQPQIGAGQPEAPAAPGSRPAAAAAAAPADDAECAAKTAAHGSPAPPQVPLALAVAAGAAAAAAAAFCVARLCRRWRRRVRRAAVAKHHVFSAVLALRQPSVPLPPPGGASLEGRTLVLSDRLAVQGLEARFGCDVWKREQRAAEHTYGPADVLVAAGAAGIAVVQGEALGLGPLLCIEGAGTPNPAGRGRTHGGGEYGAAAAVAGGLADLALAVDELGTARVPAACCGAYALRATAGALPLAGAAVAAASLASPALLAADPALLLRAAQALRLPGGGAPATEVLRYLVAEDLFAAAGEQARDAMPAVVAAVKRWAGPDQAQALSLCEWLFHRLPSLAPFLPDAEPLPDGGAASDKELRAERVLHALAAAAEALAGRELAQALGPWVSARAGELPPPLLEHFRLAALVSPATYGAAQAVAGELRDALRDALADGVVFVLPTTPGPAPPAAGGGGGAYAARCAQFASLASLAGVPQAVLPLPLPGGLPLSVSLLAAHRRDLALAGAAARLGPLLAQEAAALGGAGGGQQAPAGAGPGRRGGGEPLANCSGAAAAAAAEAAKEAGNAAFRSGRYEEAARQYSAALQLRPNTAVYLANRAMAHLRLGAYGAAEADCDAALALERSAKALLRRGSARLAQGNAPGAAADFRQVLALEPHNRQAREELRGMAALLAEGGGGGGGEQLAVFT